MTFVHRMWRNIAITAALAVGLVILDKAVDIAHYRSAFLTGWLFFGTLVCLALYRSRKAVTTVPIGSAAAWLQMHTYLGALSIVLYVLHVGWRIPDGPLEIALAILYCLVSASGIAGLFVLRILPRRLTRRGEQVIFERIPTFLARLRRDAESVVLTSAKETQSSTIQQFYVAHLQAFFGGPRNIVFHLASSNRPLFTRLTEMDYMERYLSPSERTHAADLRKLVIKKDELDFQYALQLSMKAWLLVHVPMTYALFVLALLHLVLVHAFGGGM